MTFEQCINFAKKHNQQFMIEEVNSILASHILKVADGIDGYMCTERYWYNKAYPHGLCYGCFHDRYELKKDDTLARYVCNALYDDYNNVKFGVWYGYI